MMQPRRLTIIAVPRHSRNPHLDLLYNAMAHHGITATSGSRRIFATGDYDLVHYHWPEVFLNLPTAYRRWQRFLEWLALLLVIKVRGKKIIWTMHDLAAHEEQGTLLPRLFRSIFFRALDGLVSQSDASVPLMLARYPALRGKPVLHSSRGSYRAIYSTIPTKQAARERAAISAERKVMTFFGSIRPYKNVPHLIRTFHQLADPTLSLHISGECREAALAQEITGLAQSDPRIDVQLGFVPDEELAWRVRAADLIVLPFRHILNSGSVLLALSLNVPVLVPAKGGLVELAQEVGPTWVRLYPDELTPEILAEALEWAALPRMKSAPLAGFDWDVTAKESADFMRALVHQTPLPPQAKIYK